MQPNYYHPGYAWIITITTLWVTVALLVGWVANLARRFNDMSTTLDALTAQVKASTDIESSAILLITGIAAEVAALKPDAAAITDLANKLKTSGDALAAAITANTGLVTPPAPPAPAPAPAPPAA